MTFKQWGLEKGTRSWGGRVLTLKLNSEDWKGKFWGGSCGQALGPAVSVESFVGGSLLLLSPTTVLVLE